MSKKDFNTFIEKQRKKDVEEVNIDWGKKKDEWLDSLKQLYEIIDGFLSEYAKSGDLVIEKKEKSIHEELIGEYMASTLILKIKGEEVIFDPIGTNLIGSKGRVDMKGNAGIVKFVLVNKDAAAPKIKFTILVSGEPEKEEQEGEVAGWSWKISTPPPRIKYIELDEESFFDSLMEVING